MFTLRIFRPRPPRADNPGAALRLACRAGRIDPLPLSRHLLRDIGAEGGCDAHWRGR